MKKVLYLHGLESKQGGPKVDFLAKEFCVYAPEMDYKDPMFQNWVDFVMRQFQPDLIIGSSMGGYVADIIGSQLGVDVLLFNPALHSRSIEFDFDNGVGYGSQQYKRTIILGTADKIINPEITKKLWSIYGNHAEYDEIKGMGHKITFLKFANMYNKHA